ncbi:disease resistance protein RGA2-like [Corylus avellana]|uniref:disease resistance protein RGA2-like n=1 Tax=Corylus avellana TaxID=13451 RepID=UPI00286A9CE9|nr:disease resistance protein RGA2-like [Corylus avellana]
MAEAVLVDTAVSIAESLGSLALQEIGLLWGFKYELKMLGNTVSTIQAVFLDAEEQQAQNHAVKDWLRKLKDAMYDADDLLDDFSTQLLRRQVMTRDNKMAKQVRNFFSKSNQLAYGFKMGHRIKKLRKRLDEIAADRIKFGFTERPTATRTQFEHRKREDTHSFVRDEQVIGREDEKKAVKKLLLDSDAKEDVSIIPIVGIGGLGKTTLAQYVFNDEEVQNHFELRLWVCVPDPFDMKIIVQKIVECAIERRPETLEMDLLQRLLRSKMDRKRYLLVLDDVWNENRGTWLDLETLLLGGLRGSKVLITTRSTKVAEITGTVSPYLLGGLSESNSWDLFKKMAFKDGKEPKNTKLVEIGREILQKCAQVPLAIRSIGSLLYFKNSEVDWLYFKNSELYKITQQDNGIFPILKLSYDHLPSQLKQCFAYCSLFPKDFEIEVEVLIQLWIAHGFIHSSDTNRCLEDVGREYFMNLLWRSFFQDININEYGDIEACKMHDLIHDLAESVAGDECIISIPNVEKVVEITRHMTCDSLDSLRDIPTPLLKAHKMRTLLLLFPTRPSHNPVYDTIISSFECLRALNMSGSNIQDVPNFIGKLTALQTLTLYTLGKKESSIPKQKGGLRDLNSLDELRGELHIKCLEHLRSSPLEAKAANLERKQYLRSLELKWNPQDGSDSDTTIANDEQLLQNLRPHLNLKQLHIHGFAGVRLSSWVSLLSNLVDITLWDCKWCQHIPPLDCFPSLKMLHLRKLSALEYISNDGNDVSSLSLESLTLSDLPKLRGWGRMRDAVTAKHDKHHHLPLFPSFPCLSSLDISDCPMMCLIPVIAPGSETTPSSFSLSTLSKLKSLYLQCLEELEYLPEEWLQNLTSLETLEISECRKLRIPMSPLFQHLTALEDLQISTPKELVSNEVEKGAQCLGSTTLRRLYIQNVPNLVSLPRELRHVTTLQELQIENCPTLKSLPEWIGNFTSLQMLKILNCPNLVSLPEGIHILPSLHYLIIGRCHHLEERCEQGTGEDWPKIAHIPYFYCGQQFF